MPKVSRILILKASFCSSHRALLCFHLTSPRCVPKMDHHCPWTANCVSHRTLPHFLRFVFYCVAAMSYLEYFLYQRAAVIWANRHWPSVCFSAFANLGRDLLELVSWTNGLAACTYIRVNNWEFTCSLRTRHTLLSNGVVFSRQHHHH